jgi:hypothetical protein
MTEIRNLVNKYSHIYSYKKKLFLILQADWVDSVQLPDSGSTGLETKKKTGHSAVSSAVTDLTPGHPAVSSAVGDLTPGHPAVSSAVGDLTPGHPAVSSAVFDLTPGHHHSWVSTQLDEQKKNLGSIHGFLATLHTMKI